MTERVVHVLEVVQVEEEHRHDREVAIGLFQRQGQGLLEHLAVRQAG
jgi:hypothetical protein